MKIFDNMRFDSTLGAVVSVAEEAVVVVWYCTLCILP